MDGNGNEFIRKKVKGWDPKHLKRLKALGDGRKAGPGKYSKHNSKYNWRHVANTMQKEFPDLPSTCTEKKLKDCYFNHLSSRKGRVGPRYKPPATAPPEAGTNEASHNNSGAGLPSINTLHTVTVDTTVRFNQEEKQWIEQQGRNVEEERETWPNLESWFMWRFGRLVSWPTIKRQFSMLKADQA